jgi:DNA-directed RNA polymerase specialized sigma24 family protein
MADPLDEYDALADEGYLGLGADADISESWFEWQPPPPSVATLADEYLADGELSVARRLLSSGSADTILTAIWEGDPLGIHARTIRLCGKLAMLIDAERVCCRALAQIATEAAMDGFCGDRLFPAFADARIAEALDGILDEDWAEERLGLPVDPYDERYRLITLGTGMNASDARRVSLAFNKLPDATRRPIYAVLVENRLLADVATEYGLPKPQLKELITKVLVRLGIRPGDTDPTLGLEDLP